MAAVVEAQARLNVSLRDLVQFFEQAGILQQSIDKLNEFIDKHQTIDFLTLVQAYGKCMAYINHDELIVKVNASWELFLDGLNLERKLINKKLKALREDKKADPNNVLKQEALIADIDEKKSRVVLNNVRLKAVKCTSISEFINDPNIDLDALYKQRLPALKIALGMVKQKWLL